MNKVYNFLAKINGWLAKISFVLLLIGMFFTCTDVVGRVCFTHSIKGSYELTQLWLCLLSFGCIGYIQTKQGHVNVTILLQRIPKKPALIILGVMHIFCTIMCAIITYSLFHHGIQALLKNDITGMLHIPTGPFYLFCAVCMAMYCMLLAIDTIRCFRAPYDKECEAHITQKWV